MALVVSAMLASFQLLARGQGKDLEMPRETASAPSDIKHQTSTILWNIRLFIARHR